ncbi:hypothetical protein NVP1244A_146 [Vibrio phage 1.244.A._10N.261.54.C3]|nr:hypothetical protein NVP1244A_146 [Vibrio phage 1.244.A._10N.261.54.C3]AUR98774.1 hypothetical protein NVP1255O_146 [Vibrio phage 1.255.O._10N.286.45.F1]
MDTKIEFPIGLKIQLQPEDMSSIFGVVVEWVQDTKGAFTIDEDGSVYVWVGLTPEAVDDGWDIDVEKHNASEYDLSQLPPSTAFVRNYMSRQGLDWLEDWNQQIIHVKFTSDDTGVSWEIVHGS